MKATELMIGNWVQSPKSGKYFKAENIYGGNNEAMHCISAKTADGEFCNKGLWNPIPLTTEILEHNFSKDPAWKGAYFINDCLHIYYEESNNCWIIQFMEFVELRYVHELQNALTLCKIEKEIEL